MRPTTTDNSRRRAERNRQILLGACQAHDKSASWLSLDFPGLIGQWPVCADPCAGGFSFASSSAVPMQCHSRLPCAILEIRVAVSQARPRQRVAIRIGDRRLSPRVVFHTGARCWKSLQLPFSLRDTRACFINRFGLMSDTYG